MRSFQKDLPSDLVKDENRKIENEDERKDGLLQKFNK